MRRMVALVVLLGVGGCAEAEPEQRTDTGMTVRRELTREEAIAAAKRLVASARVDSLVFLDSVEVSLQPEVWRVAFRRRWMAAPFQMTIDVDRRTGAARFLGDE